MMLKKYKFWLAVVILTGAIFAAVQGCGTSPSSTSGHTIYGATS